MTVQFTTRGLVIGTSCVEVRQMGNQNDGICLPMREAEYHHIFDYPEVAGEGSETENALKMRAFLRENGTRIQGD